MTRGWRRSFSLAAPLTWALAAAVTQAAARVPDAAQSVLADRVTSLSRDASWTLVASVPMAFNTYHPQGMVKIGATLYVSSVEVRTAPQRFPQAVGGYDRDPGSGVGHLFKIDMRGNLLADLTLGEGTMYHPGGIDYDGRDIWVPVSEYRPGSRAIIYRVAPDTMKATEVFRFADHIGGIVHNTDDHTLHGITWGSRAFYRWTLDDAGRVTNAAASPETLRTLNTSHYVDYQDCKYAGGRRMLCTGLAEFRVNPTTPAFRLGGLELVSLADGRPLHQVPVPVWTPGGLDMTHNPAWIEPSETGLRAYFMPEDNQSTLYVYDVTAR